MAHKQARPKPTVADVFRPDVDVRLEFVDWIGALHVFDSTVEDIDADGLRISLRGPGPNPLGSLQPGRHLHFVVHHPPDLVVAGLVEFVSAGPANVAHITPPARLAVTSRRRLYRVDVDIRVHTSRGPARVLNLSGGGCLLRMDAPPSPQVGDALELRLPLESDLSPLHLRAHVVHMHRPELDRPFLGMAFDNRMSSTEDALVRFVFARQAEMLRGGRAWGHPRRLAAPSPLGRRG